MQHEDTFSLEVIKPEGETFDSKHELTIETHDYDGYVQIIAESWEQDNLQHEGDSDTLAHVHISFAQLTELKEWIIAYEARAT